MTTETTAAAPAAAPAATVADPAPAAVAAAAPAPAAVAAAESGFDWTKTPGIDADSAAWLQNQGFKDPGVLTKSYRDLQKLTGALDKIVKLPASDTPEEWNAVYDKLGRPPTPGDYKLEVPTGGDPTFANEMSKAMHGLGLSVKQGQELVKAYGAFADTVAKAETTAAQTKLNAEDTALKAEWKVDYEKNVALGRHAASELKVAPEHVTALEQVLGHAATMKFFHEIGSRMGTEDTFVAGGKQSFNGISPSMAAQKITELRNDKGFAARFASKDAVTAGDARAEMNRLHKIAYPGTVDF